MQQAIENIIESRECAQAGRGEVEFSHVCHLFLFSVLYFDAELVLRIFESQLTTPLKQWESLAKKGKINPLNVNFISVITSRAQCEKTTSS